MVMVNEPSGWAHSLPTPIPSQEKMVTKTKAPAKHAYAVRSDIIKTKLEFHLLRCASAAGRREDGQFSIAVSVFGWDLNYPRLGFVLHAAPTVNVFGDQGLHSETPQIQSEGDIWIVQNFPAFFFGMYSNGSTFSIYALEIDQFFARWCLFRLQCIRHRRYCY